MRDAPSLSQPNENLTDFLLLAVDKIDGILGIANEATIEDMIIENSHTILSSAASIAAKPPRPD